MKPSPNTQSGTREKILDAAEVLLIEHGFAATSLRAIASKADVNLAATHYHFGSKNGLLAAVFHRRMQPITRARLQALSRLELSEEPITVKAVLKAFMAPFYHTDNSELLHTLPSLIGRIHGEPESITKPILEQEFAETADRYIGLISSILPDLPADKLRWRFHFTVGAMIQLLRFHSPLWLEPTPKTHANNEEFIRGLDQFIDYAAAGIEQAQHDEVRA